MAGWSLLCSMLVVCALQVGAGISGKGFFCRDPDTGKLYPVNTTWPSKTFCGSYTCKLRRKNDTDNGNISLRLNITKNEDSNLDLTSKGISFKEDVSDNNDKNTTNVEENIVSPLKQKETHSDVILNEENVRNIIKQRIKTNDGKHDGDRYLTEDEIKSLTDLLHTVKKSDLEAIVEMYNLAQDVYKEMDTATDENLIEETIKDLQKNKHINQEENEIYVEDDKKHTSYWYEPLADSLHKHKPVKIDLTKKNDGPFDGLKFNTKDMQIDGSNISPVVRPTNNLPYFTGALTNDDFRKLPYYYPMSSFQRLSSYFHPPKYVNLGNNILQEVVMIPSVPPNIIANNIQHDVMLQNEIPPKTKAQDKNPKSTSQNSILHNIIQQSNAPKHSKIKPPCLRTLDNLKYLHIQPSWINKIVKKPFNVENQRIIKRFEDETEKKSEPVTKIENKSDGNIWKFVDLNNKYYNNHVPGYMGTVYIARIPHAILVNSEPMKEKKNEDASNEKEKMPDWQTNQLSKSVLDEVKANVESKPKLFPHPLRKNVKLERVGKVIKFEEFIREKREASSKEETKGETAQLADIFEVYVHKSTCDSDTEPGFFRMGNVTEPYPACCPQRIGKSR